MIIYDSASLESLVDKLKKEQKKIVWTNGCFDIIHPGHIKSFEKAKSFWDVLIVGINSDSSPYWSSKPGRPINDQHFRSQIIDSIKYIDYVYLYDEETPIIPISKIIPDVLIKWWDYIDIKAIVWYDIVVNNGGKVLTVPLESSYSTTAIVKKILSVYSQDEQ